MAMQITDFLKLTLDDISTLAPVPMDESTLVQPMAMDAETNITTAEQMLTNIPEKSTVDQSTSMDIMPPEPAAMARPTAPAVDPRIYLATPAIPPGPPIITTVAAARYSAPVRFSKQIISDPQWQALAAALIAYHFPAPLSGMLFPKHHRIDYPDTLKKEIQCILLLQPTPALMAPQVTQLAPVIACAAVQPPTALPLQPVPQPPLPATQLLPTAPMDVQIPQAPSTFMLALDHHGQPI
uniref:Uncharacterized protein n=1 Tax=Romanomermis culicivorax TaxID=13658 RepID=A0A915HZN0_ROMCU